MIAEYRLNKDADVVPETLGATVWGNIWRSFARCFTPALEGVTTDLPLDVEAAFLGYPAWGWTKYEDDEYKRGLLMMFRRFRPLRSDLAALDLAIRAYGVEMDRYLVLFSNRPEDVEKAEGYGVILNKGFMVVVSGLSEARSRGLEAFIRAEWPVGLFGGFYSESVQNYVIPAGGIGDISYYTE